MRHELRDNIWEIYSYLEFYDSVVNLIASGRLYIERLAALHSFYTDYILAVLRDSSFQRYARQEADDEINDDMNHLGL